MGKASRDKGARFERAVANMFKDYGYDAHRTAQYRGNTGQAGDVEGVPYLHLECKHYKEIGRVYDWHEQAVRDASAEGKGNLPTVIFKADNKPIMCLMAFDDWIELYNEYRSSKTLLKKWGIDDATQ